jgi:3-methylcrotonyl-CoA carboxylase beta subunit
MITKTPLYQSYKKLIKEEAILKKGGGDSGKERQKRLGRMTARERINALVDDPEEPFEIGLWQGDKLYEKEWKTPLPAAGVIVVIATVSGRKTLIIANDATVKAGAFFPQTVKKVIRAQRIAYECKLPIIYLVDSSGVFLPLQDEIFPDEDDFGRIFRNNSILSASGIPQYAAIMGNCIAGGAYLPVLCDKLLMTEGSGLYLAGPALVKEAIGQVTDSEELGGAAMHSEISGTVDFLEPDDLTCLTRIRSLIDLLPQSTTTHTGTCSLDPKELYNLISPDGTKEYDAKTLVKYLIDDGSFNEYKEHYGQTLITVYAKIGGQPVGIIANQRKQCHPKNKSLQIGGVIYADSADKTARFIMDCNQSKIPLLFLQDVMGFMVGKEAEQSGIIRSGAKLVNAISNSIVPKITIIIGSSYGAGNYALCGKAYDPQFILAWPNAKYAVMGAEQASGTLFNIQKKSLQRKNIPLDEDELASMKEKLRTKYFEQANIRYGAARGWVDAIIPPHETRKILIELLSLVNRNKNRKLTFHTGVLQV